MELQRIQKFASASLAVSVLLGSLGTSMANISLPSIAHSFEASFIKVRWVILVYLIASTLFSLLVGRLGDLKGRRRTLIVGTIIFASGTLLSGLAPFFWLLLLARMLQGIGASALLVLPMAIVTEVMPPEKTGRAIGLLATVSAVGTASGPSLGGFFLGFYGWRAGFLIMAVLALTNAYFLQKFLAVNESKAIEGQQTSKFIEAVNAVYRDSSIRQQLFANLTVSAVMMATLIVGPFYLTKGLLLSAAQAGLVISAGPITSVVAGFFCGYAVDRFGANVIVKIGLGQLLLGSLSFAWIPSAFGAAGFALSAILLSLGYQLFLSANSSSLMRGVSSHRRGLVSGGLSLSRNLGLISGTFMMGYLFDFASKGSSPANGLRATFLFAALLILLLLLKNLNPQQRRSNEARFANQVY